MKEYLYDCEILSLLELELLILTLFIFWDDKKDILKDLYKKIIKSLNFFWDVNPELVKKLLSDLYINTVQFLYYKNKSEDIFLLEKTFKKNFTSEKFSLNINISFDFFNSVYKKNIKKSTELLAFLKEYDHRKYTILSKITQGIVCS
ncbi:hypothetical protein [Enterococcus camelliae]|uniref:Uncharacterized protein n=1 Tax=Enterococcus camelliae TaxID=453959 RepID=A0ABW5TN24_9ENTE